LTTHAGADCSTEIVRQKYVFPSLEDTLPEESIPSFRLKILIVTTEFVGPVNNGGIGTAYTTMAFRLTAVGHQVTVLFTMGTVSQHGPFEDWVKHYQEQGIELVGLYRPPIKYLPRHMLESYEVLRFLRDRANFDIVHFHDYQGAGYYPMLAKQQGYPELQNMSLVVGLHGPNLWAKSVGNQETINQIGDLEMDYQERKSVEMADYVVSPSRYLLEWMSKEGWPVHNRSFVQPNLLPLGDRRKAGAPDPEGTREVRELVFFARLETRKGVVMFCDAVEQLLRPQVAGLYGIALANLQRVTFLGRGAMVHGQFGVTYVQERAKSWSVPWKIISRLGPEEAKQYLLAPGLGRLAVMPSRIENSPYTVLECAELGIPFLASSVGGVPDLVHPDDHSLVLFEPTTDVLVGRLVSALSKGVPTARPRFGADQNEQVWLKWHNMVKHRHEARVLLAEGEEGLNDGVEEERQGAEMPFVSVVITHYNRPQLLKLAVESVENQDYPASSFEVILLDDGSTQTEALEALDNLQPNFEERGWTIVRSTNIYLGAARNKAVTFTKGKYILFMDDDNYAKPHEISTFVRAMESSGADVLTSFVDFFYGLDRPELTADRPSYLFLGGSADVGAFKNCFGDANCFVRKSSFEAIGGYTEDYGVGFEDWEMYANASLRGFKVDIVPEAVYCYRFTQGSMQKTTDFFKNRRRSLRPYLDSLPDSLHSVILNAVFPRRDDGSISRPVGLAAEGDSRFHGVDNIVDAQLSAQNVGNAANSQQTRHDEL